MRRAVVVLAACLAVAVGIPAVWFATRPSAQEGVPVTTVGAAAPTTPSPSPTSAAPFPTSALPSLTARPAAPAPGPSGENPAPRRLAIPAIGVDARVDAVGVDDTGAMVVPKLARAVGWYRFGPPPGAPAGAAVLAGHVDSATQGAGALVRLRELSVGDGVQVTTADGARLDYRVVGKQTFVKQRLPVERLFARDGAPRLVLITCGGPFLEELRSYRDNVVVVAEPRAAGSGP
jgi:sortase (surface protein transpeptidase)